MKMTLELAKQEIAKLGFTFNSPDCEKWGTMPAEPYTNDLIKNNHWTPLYRSVYIGDTYPIGGPYITSSIHGNFRRYKTRKYNTYMREFANIFGHGATLELAVQDFVNKFKSNICGESRMICIK